MNKKKTLWIIPIIGLVFVALIFVIDHRHSQDITIIRDLSISNDSLIKKRELIQVEMRVFRELVADLQNKKNFVSIKEPRVQTEGEEIMVVLDVRNVPLSGKNKLMGEHENAKWEAYYKKDNNLHFDVKILENGDTVIDCPAYIFAKMVELCEE